jgi:DNA-binding NtrC family response regulator
MCLMTDERVRPIARIRLGMGAPEGVSELLSGLGVDLLSQAEERSADLSVDFVDEKSDSSVPPTANHVKLAAKLSHASCLAADFASDSPHALASFILSRALKLPTPLLTADEGMFSIIRMALGAASGPKPVLVEGETGTGKELLVRLIHAASRRTGTLVTLHCAALGDDSVESELGAGSAGRDSQGERPETLQRAAGSTVFLDGFGDLSSSTRTKLASIMRQAGSDDSGRYTGPPDRSVHYIAATTRPLMSTGDRDNAGSGFHNQPGLVYIGLPPLRIRSGDIPMLARYFLHLFNDRLNFSVAALEMLAEYPFPGNVSELSNVVTRVAMVPLMNDAQLIDWPYVRDELIFVDALAAETRLIWELSREAFRREMVLHAIELCGGDREAAARKLGISARALMHLSRAPSSPIARARRGKPGY